MIANQGSTQVIYPCRSPPPMEEGLGSEASIYSDPPAEENSQIPPEFSDYFRPHILQHDSLPQELSCRLPNKLLAWQRIGRPHNYAEEGQWNEDGQRRRGFEGGVSKRDWSPFK
ncbi:hypothetical protein AVEN_198905-1 [Araneus ventricosus]|uniref:Uncharacterized protein n=1 Tax=Araneus ventricosus TaxID=182803 RepID=A0A4Y2QGE8_ARAVE|nr:hypothetical protein AVEN_198905-1 [Araneus ventricosus]